MSTRQNGETNPGPPGPFADAGARTRMGEKPSPLRAAVLHRLLAMSGHRLPSNLRDNHDRGTVADFLRTHLRPGADLDLVTACFTVFAHAGLREQLDAAKDDE